ncbi:MAG: hypothetical protein U0270_29935 [Labilithrix sp.]
MLYVFSVTIHVLAATLWVGGMGFFAIAVVPVARRTLEEAHAGKMLRGVGTRLGSVGWWLLGTLAVTGLINLWSRGVLPLMATTMFWRSPFGTTLALKLSLVALMTLVSFVHGRDARRQGQGQHVTPAARTRSSLLGRATFGLSVVVVFLAVLLVRGNP